MLKDRYKRKDHELYMREKLRNLKNLKDICSYINDFRIIVNQITNISEFDQITYFLNGLNDLPSDYVRLKNPDSLQKAIENAEDYDRFKSNRFSKNADILMLNKRNFRKRNVGSYKGYNSRNVKNFKYFKSKNSLFCKNCHKSGHESENVIKMIKIDLDKFKQRNILNINDLEKTNELLKHYVYINDNKIEAVFDTGATISLISFDVANRLNLKINPSKQRINTADDSSITEDSEENFDAYMYNIEDDFVIDDVVDLDTESKLLTTGNKVLYELIVKNKDVFSLSINDLGCCDTV
ncbi:unnamed protein product [Brachionus calyciflorus]|uniref:Uncharacterized protein n=1 Tax=Brachionus calyciflorus TaxID=104777 RepID=A0A814Q8R4_9BILA|nr:unnamed protein product [Brachionus calyciflorus]